MCAPWAMNLGNPTFLTTHRAGTCRSTLPVFSFFWGGAACTGPDIANALLGATVGRMAPSGMALAAAAAAATNCNSPQNCPWTVHICAHTLIN